MNSRKVELGFFVFLVAVAVVLTFLILKPYLGALFVALVFAIVFRPVYEKIRHRVRGAGLASFLSLSFLFLVIFVPVALFSFFIFDDAKKLYFEVGSETPILERLETALSPIENTVRSVIPEFDINIRTYLDAVLSFLMDNFGNVFSRIIRVVFQTFIMFLALFYLFRDGAKFRSFIINLSPLTNEYDERILKRLETAISSVVKGKLLIVLIQGILASLCFFMFGVPYPLLWGAGTSLAALIPAVGVAIVFIPVMIYLFIVAGLWPAIGLLIAGIVIGTVDNILGPILYEKGLEIHQLLILLSVLGGITLFGPIGFLAGPVVLALFVALLDIYPLLFQHENK